MKMMVNKGVFLVLSAVILVANGVPKNGNYHGLPLTVNGRDLLAKGSKNVTCASLALVSKSPISVSLSGVRLSSKDKKATIKIKTELYESQCEQLNEEDCDDLDVTSRSRLVAVNTQNLTVTSGTTSIPFQMASTLYVVEKTTPTKAAATTAPAMPAKSKKTRSTKVTKPEDDDNKIAVKNSTHADNETASNNQTTPTPEDTTNETTPGETTPAPKIIQNNLNQTKSHWSTFVTSSTGIYVVLIYVDKPEIDANYTLTFNVEMKNRFGFISLVDYPALITFGLLLVVYIFYSFLWLLMMACHYKDIIRLQFWVLAVILLGFTEKVFFVAEYGSANEGHNSSGLIYVAEGVSAGKRALARVLLIVVCEGFGTVRPRLGSTLTKVLVVGGIYFVAAFIDGITRASQVNTDGFDLTSLVTRVVVLFINIGVAYWIFSALVNTRRALRVRKNAVKLSLYNHLAYTLMATIIASLAFTVWELVTMAKGNCTSDWGEMWLGDCFWHILFSFILLVIMIIWRPSANKLRFAYTQVSLESADEDEEQGANKNFENIKMRSRQDGPKPLAMSQEAEDDLKWAEENLPTTLIDKTLPIVLDSEEEVMTTRFEASKMN